MARIGQVIDGKYEILKEIGRGGMSIVYLAMDKRLNKQWAVKEIPKRALDKNNEVVVQSAIAEANMIKRLDHPAIVRIVDIINNDDVIYIIEDYIEGETLGTIVENNGAQPQELVIEWAMQICEALEYLHTRKPPIIYRDMKPTNVMLKPEGNVKIIDFGIAREYKERGLADTVSLGTRGYAAPEQFGGRGQTDARTDVYCLGVTMYHLVTGQNPCDPPYEIKPIRHWNPQLSAGLEAIIEKCTQANPNDRYQSCAELLYALHHYEEYGAVYRLRQKRKLGVFIAAAAACIVFLLTGVTGLVMRTRTNNADYAQLISVAENATDSAQKISSYAAAINIKPLALDAYNGWIRAIEKDGNFEQNEERDFLQAVNKNLLELRQQPGYPDLAYEIGTIYRLYYSYGADANADNNVTKAKSAMKWFQDAMDYGGEEYDKYGPARVYYEIGKFYDEILINRDKATDRDMYMPFWENITECIVMSRSEDNDLVRLTAYSLAANAIETYAREFKSSGVSASDLKSVHQEIREAISKQPSASGYIDTSSVAVERAKRTLLDRFGLAEESNGRVEEVAADRVLESIDNAYRG